MCMCMLNKNLENLVLFIYKDIIITRFTTSGFGPMTQREAQIQSGAA